MKSRISCFNRTVFWKDITRFFPAWALYSVVLAVCWLTTMDGTQSALERAQEACDLLPALAMINFFYGPLCGALLFGDLHQPRMCNALHAMPIRRETWFCTHVLAGLCFAVIPNGLLLLALLPMVEEFALVAVLTILGSILLYLLFFGIGVFCVFCTGKRAAVLPVYGIVSFPSIFVYWMAKYLYEPLLYGIYMDANPFTRFCPIVTVMNYSYAWGASIVLPKEYSQLPHGYAYLAFCGLAGVGFLLIGLLLYRRRKLESAGDFIAFSPMRPVFLVLFSLVCAVLAYLLSGWVLQHASMIFLFVGLVLGFFGGEMLLKRTVKVFSRKTAAGCAALGLVLALSLGLTHVDVLGVTRWLPDKQSVSSVTMTLSYGYPDLNTELTLTQPEEIEKALLLHKAALGQGQNEDTLNEGQNVPLTLDYTNSLKRRIGTLKSVPLTLDYTLQNGRQVRRVYGLSLDDSAYETLESLYTTPKAVLGEELAAHPERIISVSVDSKTMAQPVGDIKAVWEAILLDCEAGTMAQPWCFHVGCEEMAYLEIYYLSESGEQVYCRLDICEKSVHTVEYLKNAGLLEETSLDKEVHTIS